MNRFFHSELNELRENLLIMGECSVRMVRLSLEALVDGDVELAARVRAMDDEVDALEDRTDREIVRYLTLFGPLGRDIRLLLTARDISRELERIADEASVIARRVPAICEPGCVADLGRVPEMARMAERQVRLALESFATMDAAMAETVRAGDKPIDALHAENLSSAFGGAGGGREVSARTVELMFVSKGIERIGDHAKNIAEEVIFLTSGENVRHSFRRE